MSSMPAYLPIILALVALVGIGTWTGLEYLANRMHKNLPADARSRRILRPFIAVFRTKTPSTDRST